jgi:L-asparaginase / beta-aspartyl-peptidase
MKRLSVPLFTALLAAGSSGALASPPDSTLPKTYGLVIHGGAGVIVRERLTPGHEAEYRVALQASLNAGYAVLARGGTALDAVVAAIEVMEDSPLFNAGKGAVLNADGQCELDASIMDGRTLAAGAVAGVRRIRNPILLARAVMEKSPHVMFTGDGAERFAEQLGFTFVPNDYFQTERRRGDLKRAQEKEKEARQRRAATGEAPDPAFVMLDEDDPLGREFKWGTVGCVALDQHGNLAAGTSTGGMTNKKFGRVGDSPIIGAGTYADNATCAVSATGHGEYFIRVGVARDIVAQMAYRGTPVRDAAAATLAKVAKLGGDGGVICIDREGNIAMPFNTAGMYRGFRLSTGATAVGIFGEDR